MNWNILLTLGKKIKRDSKNNVNESRTSFKIKQEICLNKEEPSFKTKYGITSYSEWVNVSENIEIVILQGYFRKIEKKKVKEYLLYNGSAS